MSPSSRVVKTSLSEIKDGSYIGVTGLPEPDGTQKAIAVHIFPENQRGAAEGFRPWDARANSTMTNATVAQTVKGTDGQNITVKYKDGEKKVMVPPDTPIVTFVASDRSEIKPGASYHLRRGKKEDGRSKPTGSMWTGMELYRRCKRCDADSQAGAAHGARVPTPLLTQKTSSGGLLPAFPPTDRRASHRDDWSSISSIVLTPHRPMVLSSSFWMMSIALATPACPPAPRP